MPLLIPLLIVAILIICFNVLIFRVFMKFILKLKILLKIC